MARVFAAASNQYLSASSTLLSNEPITLFIWGKPNDITTDRCPIGLGNNGATGNYYQRWAGSTVGDPVRAYKEDDAGSGAVSATSATGYSTDWHNVGASYRSDTSRDVYIDGGGKGSNTTSRADPTPNFISIGALRRSTVVLPFDGSIAEAFFMDYSVTDAQHASLGIGIHPIDACIPIANVRGWYPLMGDDNNRMGGGYPDLAPTASPTFGLHPFNPIYPKIGALLCL